MGDFYGEGNTIQHTPSGADVAAGEVVVIEDKVTIAKSDIKDGVMGEVSTNGQFYIKKDEATAFAQGKTVYFDAGAKEATEADGGGANKKIGYVAVAALAADTHVICQLSNNV